MSRARVWAPAAGRVSVQVAGRSQGLDRTSGGWWESAGDVLQHDTDYQFRLDGGEPLPDPRSPWQPEGVHGPSRWVDHSRFGWFDAGWRAPDLPEAVFYELHVGTFTPAGTFAGVAQRLPYLRELGVTHVELMPVNAFPGDRGWGYDGVDLYAPHHSYGGPQELKRLVDAAHQAGLAMVLDVVYNHFGPDGNYLGRFGPYLTERYGTPWGGAVNLDDQGSDEVRRFLIDNALMWLRDYHFDGLRLDAVHALVDMSAVHFLEELSQAVDRLEDEVGRPLTLIAESDLNDPRVIRPRADHGYGLDAQWSDELHHALHVTLTGEREGYYADFGGLADLCTALSRGWVYDWRHSPARGRRHGRSLGGMPRWRLLSYSQNHDQVGNRAAGERLSQLVERDALRVAAALVILGPHVPLLFQGEEWAASTPFQFFTDHTKAELGRAVTKGRAREFATFGWDPAAVPDPQSPETFARSRLDWSEREREPHAGVLQWYRRLLRARRTIPGLHAGPLPEVRCDEARRWLSVERSGTLLLANLAAERREVPLSRAARRLVLASAPGVDLGEAAVGLPPMSVALLLDR